MKIYGNYTISEHKRKDRKKLIIAVAELIAIVLIIVNVVCTLQAIGFADAADRWILCKPKDWINVRETPSKNGAEAGYLECGDHFRTDGKERNGFVHVLSWGECGDAWVYGGYVVDEEPTAVFANYVCVAKKQAICRKWIDGPKTATSYRLKSGQSVTVFYEASGWAVTSRGYVRSEWLEVD